MQLPFGKQIVAAAIIAIVAPSATVIGAQSFSDFVSKPNTVRIAQETIRIPDIGAGTLRIGAPGDRNGAPALGRKEPPERRAEPVDRKPPVGRGEEPGDRKVPEAPVRRQEDRSSDERPASPATPNAAPSAASSGLEDCVRKVVGDDELYDRFRKGEFQLSEEQRKAVNEQCASFKGKASRKGGAPTGDTGSPARPPSAPDGDGAGSGTQTCNVNGTEMPGPCSQYEGRGSDGSDGSGWSEGPSDEDMERMEKERKVRMLQEMKRNLKGMEQGLRMLERGLKVCTAAKVDASAASEAIAQIKEVIAKVKAAEDPDEVQDVMMDLSDHFDSARETLEVCHRLRELPRITKQLTNEVKRIERELKNATAQAKRAKMDLTDQLNEITAGLTAVKEAIANVAQVKTADEFDEAMESIESLRETFEDLQEKLGAIRGVLNVSRGIADARREIRDAERLVSALKRKKVDTAPLQVLITEGKGLIAEIEALAKQRPIDPDAIHEKFEQLEDLGARADDMIATIQGKEVRSTGPQFSRSPVEGAKIPDSFRQFSPKKDEGSEDDSDLEALLGF